MKPCNFPERKRERQLGTLLRLQENFKRGYYVDINNESVEVDKKLVNKEIKVLEKRTLFSRRDIRTKKTRSA